MRERRHSGIPLLPGPLVGREAELAEARQLLLDGRTRLLTLTGPPGVGKTCLALALAAEVEQQFADGATLVDLSAITDADLVAAALADGLGAGGGQRPLERLVTFLVDRHCLLVVDNFEQVIAAAALIAELLRACPSLTVLVTSRAPLRLRWEHELPLAPLELPGWGGVLRLDALATTPAVQLFVERAHAVSPGFALTRGNAAAVTELCRRLDGLPLAIELAAARARLLSPEAMLRQLGGPGARLQVLAGGPRDLPERQQALRAAFDWSYALLDASEQALFRRLAVFAGGCTIEAIESVGFWATGDGGVQSSPVTSDSHDPTPDTLKLVESLVERSLLRHETSAGGAPRLRMLETIREYALERLAASGESALLRARHAAYYLALAELAEPELEGSDQAAWLDRLDGERDNLRAAGRWAAEHGDAETVLRLGAALWRFWWARGTAVEAHERVEGMLALASVMPPSPARAKALHGAGVLAHELGDYPRAQALFEEALAVGRQLGDLRLVCGILDGLGWLGQQRGQYVQARALLGESLDIAQKLGDERASAGILTRLGYVAFAEGRQDVARDLHQQSLARARATGDRRIIGEALFNLGLSSHVDRDLAAARRSYEESRSTLQEIGHRHGLAQTLHMLAHVDTMTGDVGVARARFRESLVTAREAGNLRRQAFALWTVAALAVASGEPERAIRLDAAASAAAESIGAVLALPVRELYDALLAPAHQALGEDGVAAACQAGHDLALRQAVDDALTWLSEDAGSARSGGLTPAGDVARSAPVAQPTPPDHTRSPMHAPGQATPDVPDPTLLTPREREIAALIARGLTSREIAERLVIGKGTADAHADHIRGKLGLRSRAEIAAWAVSHGLLDTLGSSE